MLSVSTLVQAVEGQEKVVGPSDVVGAQDGSLVDDGMTPFRDSSRLAAGGQMVRSGNNADSEGTIEPGVHVYLLAMLDQRTPGKNHSGCAELELCAAVHIAEGTYPTVHVGKDCSCSLVSVSGP